MHRGMVQTKLLAMVALPAALLAIAACGSSSTKTASPTHAAATSATTSSPYAPASSATSTTAPAAAGVTITTKTIAGLGPVLVNSQGHTLYVFAPDNAKKVTCVGPCAAVWPPVKISAGAKATGSGGVKASLLGTAPNPGGGDVVTYNGWPLYTYVADTAAGTATGADIKLNGGFWWVIGPSGAVIKKKP